MVEKNAISRVCKEQEGFFFQLFMVPKKDGGQRPIINLKKLNSLVQTDHFKMEGIHMLKDLLKPGDWMTKVDLKDAYFMIPVATNHRSLLQFKWIGKTYQFNCLPFGLSSAPWVFTKTTKPIVAILRTMGLSPGSKQLGLYSFWRIWASSSTTQNPFLNFQRKSNFLAL